MSGPSQTVAVLGASDKKERYSNQAVVLLKERGHRVIPVHPVLAEIEGLPVVRKLEAISEAVDTLTVYVGPERSRGLIGAIVDLAPGRVILNPGAESPELEAALAEHGIPCQKACTLVLLRTGQF